MRKKIKLNENFIDAIGNEPFDFTDFVGSRALEDTQRQLPEGTKLEVIKDLPYEDIEGIRYMLDNSDDESEDERLSSLSDEEIINIAEEKGFKYDEETQEFIIPKGSILTAYHTDEPNSMGFYFDFNGLNLSMFISPEEDKEILVVKLFEEPLKEDVESLGNETLLSILIEENDYIAGRDFIYKGTNYQLFIEADDENGWSLGHTEKVFDADKIKLVLVELLLDNDLLFSDTVKPEKTLVSVATSLLSLVEEPLKEDIESGLYIYQFPSGINNLFGEFQKLCDEKKVSIIGKDKGKNLFVKGSLEALQAVAREIDFELADEYLSKEADFNDELLEDTTPDWWKNTYDETKWEPKDIELHKSIDWASNNYHEYAVESDSIEAPVHVYGTDEPYHKIARFTKHLRSNPIYPPYYKIDVLPLGGKTTGGMFDGEKHGRYGIHNRFETWKLYDELSEGVSLKEEFSKQDAEKYVKDITQKLFDEGEFYDIWSNDEVIEAQIISGDWKHDHLKFKSFIQKYFDDLGVEIVIDSEVEDGTTEDDVYTATYFIKAVGKGKEEITEDTKLDTAAVTTLEDAIKKADKLFRAEKPFAVIYGYKRKSNVNANTESIFLESPLVVKTQENYASLSKKLVNPEKVTRDNHVRIIGLITLFNPVYRG